MKLSYYFYKKTLFSLMICTISSSVVFYIFSLIGNLGEKLTFTSILAISFLNTLQILTQIPSFIILLSMILLIILLRSKNELVIFKEYLSSKKLIFLFIPLAITFSFIEINKNAINENIDSTQSKLFKADKLYSTKVIVAEKENYKLYTVLKGLDVPNLDVLEFQRYKISDGKIQVAEYSNQIKIQNNTIFTNNFTKFENDEISNINQRNIIVNDLIKLNNKKLVINEVNNNLIYNFKFQDIIKILYYLIFFICIFLILLNKKVIDQKVNFFPTVIVCISLFFYSIVIFNIKLSLFNTELQILAILFIFIISYKYFKYE